MVGLDPKLGYLDRYYYSSGYPSPTGQLSSPPQMIDMFRLSLSPRTSYVVHRDNRGNILGKSCPERRRWPQSLPPRQQDNGLPQWHRLAPPRPSFSSLGAEAIEITLELARQYRLYRRGVWDIMPAGFEGAIGRTPVPLACFERLTSVARGRWRMGRDVSGDGPATLTLSITDP